MTVSFLIAMAASYGVGALSALAGARGRFGRGLVAFAAAAGAAAGLALGLTALVSRAPLALSLPGLLPVGGGLALRVDPLGAFFLVVIGFGAIPAAIYGASYSAAYEDRPASLRLLGLMFHLFLLTMSLVPLADNVLTFLVMWEGMSLTSYFLVMTDAGEERARNAGLWYAGMTHVGLLLLASALLLLSGGTGAGAFADLRERAAGLGPGIRDVVFILAFLGFGSKAGIVPLHVWLPRAHPAAPSHVSALMSGVMIKMGIYGILRVALDLMGGGPAWWGGLVLGVGVVSALLGVLYALMEHDLKRLLAFHSVENVGIILIGTGAGLMFHHYGLASLAALGLIGGLYHVLNHASFKGLLFLGAGSVLHAAGTRDMERMGGLIKRMPWTGAFFLVGAMAISALPPLNGFVSEWLVFQALLGGVAVPVPEVAIVMPVAVAALALTSGLAAACFVKAFGIAFLALPRSPEAERAHESPFSMRLAMGLLALACVALGVAPFAVVPLLSAAVAALAGLPDTRAELAAGLSLQAPAAFGRMSPALMALGLALLVGAIPLALRVLRLASRPRPGDAWGCGRVGQTARMEYTATAFAEPLSRVFAEIYRPMRQLSVDFHPGSRYFVQSIEYRSGVTPWFEQFLYRPFLQSATFVAERVRRLQAGSLHLYLLYMAAVLALLLILARWL
ncbi:MAG TPA: hydrogenase 4 subunit B [candidate division Zixibacteria bacterium]|nr:hydrogenase 4 subunit B [candidate division Zixibacteria bacterium]